MTHPGAPRDVDLAAWLDKIAFHPADSAAKQIGHEYARSVVAALGATLHDVVPPCDDKSTAYQLLGELLMYVNRALAVHGGPQDASQEAIESMRQVVAVSEQIFADAGLAPDARIEAYKAEQRGEVLADDFDGQDLPETRGWRVVTVIDGVTVYNRPGGVLLQTGTSEPVELDDPSAVEALTSHLLHARNQAWPAA